MYSWSPSSELSSTTIEDPIFTATADGSKSYTLTVTDPSNGCTASSSFSFVVSSVPKVASVASISPTLVCVSGTVSARAFGTGASYQWQTSSDNINFTDISGATDDTLSLFVNVDTYVRAKTICSDSSFSASIFYDVAVPVMASVENDTVCGQGNVSLIGTPGAGFYSVWYTEETGGLFLQLGDTLNTFVAATDTFWVAASVAPVPAPGPAPTGYPANSATFTGDEDITAVTIGSLVNNQPAPNCALYTDYTALPAPILVPGATVPFSISIGDCENASFFSSGVAMFIDFDRNGSFGDAGEQVYATAVTTNGLYTVSGTFTVPLTASIGFTRARIINAEGFPTPTFNQSYSYGETEDYLVQIGSNVCQSARVPVIAVVNTAPAFEVTPSAASICEGNSVNIDVTTGGADYTIFSWTPAAGLNTVSGPNVIANPTVNSTYYVTASGNAFGCVSVDTAVITVNPAPIFTVASNLPSVCNGDTVTVTATVISPVATNYVASPITFAPVSPTGAPTVLVSGGVAVVPQTVSSLDDGTWEGLPLPAGFAFNYYGTTPTQFNVSTNGFITFGASLGNAYCCSGQVIPNAATPNDYLAISHEDMLLSASGDIDYFTVGVAPNRKFVVRFTNVPRFGGTGAPTTGQIVLNETVNSIEYHITSVTTAAGDATTMGIEDGTGTYATVISGRNSTSPWTATNEGWSFAPPTVASLSWTGQNIIGSNTALAIQANPSSSGYYAVTVTNPATGCFKSDSVLVNASVSPSPIITPGDTALCFPNSIYLFVEDTGAFVGGYPAGTQYNWINITGGFVPDLDSINTLNGSTYQVIVKLPSGCLDTSSVRTVITRAVAVVPTIVNSSCAGAGSITATVTSGLPPYNFVWSTDLAQTNIIQNVTQSSNVDVLSNLLAGTYYLSISDSAGSPVSCNSGVLTYTVSGTGAIVATASVVQGVSCNGVNDGSVAVSASGGSGPLSYLWSNGQTTATISGLLAGNYSVIVSDGSGCADTAYVTLIDPAVLGLTFTTTPESAPGANDGTVTGIVSGGTGPFSFQWLDSLGLVVIGTNNPQTGLPAGLYYGVVTDNNGCQFADTVRIDVVNNAVFNITALIEGYYNGTGGLVTALSNSGVAAGPTECDTIYVELRDQISPTTVLASGTAVLSTSGQASFTFPASVIGQNGYIAVFHRNAVQTWSDIITFSATTNYDFTTAASQAYNGNQREVAPGVWAFYSGDLSPQDEFIDILDQGVIDNDIFNFVGGYVVSDLSGDGFVDIVDQSIVDNNIFNFIGSSHP